MPPKNAAVICLPNKTKPSESGRNWLPWWCPPPPARARHALTGSCGGNGSPRVVFEACSDGTSRLACHIRGDHAYFYGDPVARRVIATLPVSIPRAAPPATLEVRARVNDEGYIKDWTLLGEYVPGLEGHLYAVGSAQMLGARKRMHELRICPRVALSGPCVQDVSKLTVREREREDFVLHRVPPSTWRARPSSRTSPK
jgi:hypothetical protein